MLFKYNSSTPPRKLYNKLRVSDGVILARNVLWPTSTDDAPIQGDDGSVKFLAISEAPVPTSPKDYDARYFSILSTEGPEEGWATLPNPAYFITHVPTKRTIEEITANAENEELLARNTVRSPTQTTSDLYILIAALARSQQNLNLTEDEQATLDEAIKIAAVLSENKASLKGKKTAILSGATPDLGGYKLSSNVP